MVIGCSLVTFSFFVTVKAWRGDATDNYGLAVMMFQVNEPPLVGNCTVFPPNGTAVQTFFNVECSEFYDQHKPVMYQVWTRTSIINWYKPVRNSALHERIPQKPLPHPLPLRNCTVYPWRMGYSWVFGLTHVCFKWRVVLNVHKVEINSQSHYLFSKIVHLSRSTWLLLTTI